MSTTTEFDVDLAAQRIQASLAKHPDYQATQDLHNRLDGRLLNMLYRLNELERKHTDPASLAEIRDMKRWARGQRADLAALHPTEILP
jgi:hypothetical protein